MNGKWLPESEPEPDFDLGDPRDDDVVMSDPVPETYRFRHNETGVRIEIEYVRSERTLRVCSADVPGAKLIRLVTQDGIATELVLATASDLFLACRLDLANVRVPILVALQDETAMIDICDRQGQSLTLLRS